jgi:predicted site-specific integrase-resolvase
MKLSEYALKKGIAYKTAYLHFTKGLIKDAYQSESGAIFVKEEDVSWKDELIVLQREKIKRLEEELASRK